MVVGSDVLDMVHMGDASLKFVHMAIDVTIMCTSLLSPQTS